MCMSMHHTSACEWVETINVLEQVHYYWPIIYNIAVTIVRAAIIEIKSTAVYMVL